MKIAIDTGNLSSGHAFRGIGAQTRETIQAIKEEAKKRSDIEIDAFDFSANSEKLETGGYDIVHYTAFNPFFVNLPFAKPPAKVILTIDDLVPLRYPGHYVPGIKGKLRYWMNRYLIKRNVDVVITISETSKKDICGFLGIGTSKVHVVYLAAPSAFKKPINNPKLSLPPKFVLYLGDVNYNKNIPTLIKACEIVNIPLVIVGKHAIEIEDEANLNPFKGPMDYLRYLFGKTHPEVSHFQELVEKFKGDSIIRLGYISYEDLYFVFQQASVYVQPSFYEGFGIPLTEAFTAGCPVVASNTSVLVEIGRGGALFADPKDPKDFAAKIKQVIEDNILRDQLIETAKVVVKNYTWEKTAKETLKVYNILRPPEADDSP